MLFLAYYFLSGNSLWFLAVIACPIVAGLLWMVDNIVFAIRRPFEVREMVKMIHRYRYELLKQKKVGIPRIDKTEERGGYE